MKGPAVRQGQAIVEVIIAFAVAVVAIVGLVSVATKSVSNSGVSKRQSTATAYATQAMEWVRQQRDVMSWTDFAEKVSAPSYCLGSTLPAPTSWPGAAASCGGCLVISNTEFTRCITLSSPGANQVQAIVTVTWPEGVRTMNTNQTTIFTGY